MAKNRKSQSVAVRFGPAIKALVICLLIGGSGVGYVWQKEQIAKLGGEIKQREGRLRMLEEQNDRLQKQFANMQSLPFLQAKIKDMKLGLEPQQQSQVLRLWEPTVEVTPITVPRQYPLQASRRPAAP